MAQFDSPLYNIAGSFDSPLFNKAMSHDPAILHSGESVENREYLCEFKAKFENKWFIRAPGGVL